MYVIDGSLRNSALSSKKYDENIEYEQNKSALGTQQKTNFSQTQLSHYFAIAPTAQRHSPLSEAYVRLPRNWLMECTPRRQRFLLHSTAETGAAAGADFRPLSAALLQLD